MVKSALLVMDVQIGVVAHTQADDAYLARVSSAITAARQANMQIIYPIVGPFRASHPEIVSHNMMFGPVKAYNKYTASDEGIGIHPAVAPQEDKGDIIVNKKRVSAFSGSDLDLVLRGLGVGKLVLCGISISGIVLSTVRDAADRDFEMVVLKDACWGQDEEVNKVLLEKVFPQQATVVAVEEWAAGLKGR